MKSGINGILIYFLLSPFLLQGQISFQNKTTSLGITDGFSGTPIAITDVNGDFLPDIVRLNHGNILEIWIQGEPERPFVKTYSSNVSKSGIWSIVVGDINNDRNPDIIVGGNQDTIKVLINQGYADSFIISNLPQSVFYLQGSNLLDINNDGWIDYFAANDFAANKIYLNDGNGSLLPSVKYDKYLQYTEDTLLGGNYGSVITDINVDGRPDIYVSKCRAGVSNPTDLRRVNALFLNYGDSLVQDAELFGLANGSQSWAADFSDVDNDGDLDAFLIHHDRTCQLLIREGDLFIDGTDSSGILEEGKLIQSKMEDFDNDGLVDLLITGSSTALYKNNGNARFTKISNGIPGSPFTSFGMGDLNQDGFIDLFTTSSVLLNDPGDIPDAVWINDGNSNHYITISLGGMESNNSAIGAIIKIYGPWGIQSRQILSGESYGIQCSQQLNFGLGNEVSIDSILIKWPSGFTETIFDVPADRHYIIYENSCFFTPEMPEIISNKYLCESAEVFIHNPNLNLWNTGEMADTLIVKKEGIYFAKNGNTNCPITSLPVSILQNPDKQPILIFKNSLNNCYGDSIHISVSKSYEGYLWSNGQTDSQIWIDGPSQYYLDAEGLCQSFTSDTLQFDFFETPISLLQIDTVEPKVNVEIVVSGNFDEIKWFDNKTTDIPFSHDSSFIISNIVSDTSIYYEVSNTYGFPSIATFFVWRPGSDLHSPNFNGEIYFTALQNTVIDSITLFTDVPGKRTIVLLSEGVMIDTVTVNIIESKSRWHIDFELLEGRKYTLTTIEGRNLSSFRTRSPQLYLTRNTEFPMQIENLIDITGSNFGNSEYYYFYDWVIRPSNLVCSSPRTEYSVILSEPNSVNSIKTWPKDLKLYPNPFDNTLNLLNLGTIQLNYIEIFNLSGQKISSYIINSGSRNWTFNLKEIPAGIYFLQINSKEGIFSRKVVKK